MDNSSQEPINHVNNNGVKVVVDKTTSLLTKVAEQYGVDRSMMLETLKKTVFPKEATNEQLIAFLIVATQYELNPFTKEIYAIIGKGGNLINVVSIDGWAKLGNRHSAYDGVDFRYAEELVQVGEKTCPAWIEAIVYRKDRAHPTVVREKFSECYRSTKEGKGPWDTHPERMLRHKVFIQALRYAFSFAGIADPDEAESIIDSTHTDPQARTKQVLAKLPDPKGIAMLETK